MAPNTERINLNNIEENIVVIGETSGNLQKKNFIEDDMQKREREIQATIIKKNRRERKVQ